MEYFVTKRNRPLHRLQKKTKFSNNNLNTSLKFLVNNAQNTIFLDKSSSPNCALQGAPQGRTAGATRNAFPRHDGYYIRYYKDTTMV